jgi:hypothetical protein
LTTSIEKALKEHKKDPSLCKKKVFIIVPDSCQCHASLSDEDPRITRLETIHPVYVSLAGTRRPYHFDMYTFNENGEVSMEFIQKLIHKKKTLILL